MERPEIQVRTARLEDAVAFAALYAPYVQRTPISFEEIAPSADEMARRVADVLAYAPWLTALVDDAIVGYAYASRHAERAGYRWSIDVSVYIDERFHRRGIGRKLYNELLQIVERLNYRRAYAGVTLPNEGSVALHRAFGFELVGTYARVGWKQGKWYDVAWFGRDLGSHTDDTQPDDGAKPAEPILFSTPRA
jgi:L-amino acid N-acyltransferase YncA